MRYLSDYDNDGNPMKTEQQELDSLLYDIDGNFIPFPDLACVTCNKTPADGEFSQSGYISVPICLEGDCIDKEIARRKRVKEYLADKQVRGVTVPPVPVYSEKLDEKFDPFYDEVKKMRTRMILPHTYMYPTTQQLMDDLTAIVFGSHEKALYQKDVDSSHDWMLGSANDWWATLLGGVVIVDSRLPFLEKHSAIRVFLKSKGAVEDEK